MTRLLIAIAALRLLMLECEIQLAGVLAPPAAAQLA